MLENATIVMDGKTQKENAFLVMQNGKIIYVGHEAIEKKQLMKDVDEVIDVGNNYVLPGFIDIHIHGAMQKDLIEGSQAALDGVAYNVVKDGCTSFMASLTVVSHDEMLSILKRYATISQPIGGANWLGIHEEGPYLSKEYKALMDERYLRDPSIEEYFAMQEACNHKIKIMSVAPERVGMQSFINRVSEDGVSVMLGHTNANVQDVHMAVQAGAKGFTHLYNAMSQHMHRTPGCVTGAMIEKNTYAELICDGFHVDKDVVVATYKMFGAKRIVLISDAMLGKGAPDGFYTFSNLKCKKEGIYVRVVDTGRIAGSAFGMIDAVRFIKKHTSCSMKEIVQMACSNPAKVAKVDTTKGTLEIGKDADICILSKDLEVLYTFVGGQKVFSNIGD